MAAKSRGMLLTADSLRVPHGFFTRQGGVSEGPYASLNCSLSGGDSRDAVLENRARAAHAVGARPDDLVGLMQVHGADVIEVTLGHGGRIREPVVAKDVQDARFYQTVFVHSDHIRASLFNVDQAIVANLFQRQ